MPLKEHRFFVEMIDEMKKEDDEIIITEEKKLKIRGINIDELGKGLTKQPNQDTEKQKTLEKKHELLEKQHITLNKVVKDIKLGNFGVQEKSQSAELVVRNVKNNLVKSSQRNNNSFISPPRTPDVSNRGGRVGHGGI